MVLKKNLHNVILLLRYLGGFEGAITLAKYSWFEKFPRMTSATVFIVSVKTSAGTPLAIKILHKASKSPDDFMIFWHELVTWVGLLGDTKALMT